MEVDFEEQGIAEAIAALEALPGMLAVRVQGNALLAMAKVAAAHAQANAPEDTGELKSRIRARRRVQRVQTFRGNIRVPGGAAQMIAAAPHAFLLELGTVKAPAYPFLEPAMLSTRNAQLQAAAQSIKRDLDKLEKDLRSGNVSKAYQKLAGL